MSGADLKQMKTTKKAPDVTASAVDEGHRTVPMPFGHALIKLAETRPEIVGMSADLAKYTDIHIFAERFPDRFYQMGMSEQLMATAAGGLAKGASFRSPPPTPPSPRAVAMTSCFRPLPNRMPM